MPWLRDGGALLKGYVFAWFINLLAPKRKEVVLEDGTTVSDRGIKAAKEPFSAAKEPFSSGD
jgi:hypothetical protein